MSSAVRTPTSPVRLRISAASSPSARGVAFRENGGTLVEIELRRQEQRLRLILDGVRDHAISMLDPDGPHRDVQRLGRAHQGLQPGRGARAVLRDFLHARGSRGRPAGDGARGRALAGALRGRGLAAAQGRLALLRRCLALGPARPFWRAHRLREGHAGPHATARAQRGAAGSRGSAHADHRRRAGSRDLDARPGRPHDHVQSRRPSGSRATRSTKCGGSTSGCSSPPKTAPRACPSRS